jgi:hypothetical protein
MILVISSKPPLKNQISLLIWVMDNGSYDNAKSKHTFFKQVFDYNW